MEEALSLASQYQLSSLQTSVASSWFFRFHAVYSSSDSMRDDEGLAPSQFEEEQIESDE